jgi:LmbE family N-acetylglucosaminyl deacetylase
LSDAQPLMRMGLRGTLLAYYRRALDRRAIPLAGADLTHSAVVFSPHFDDETLGCGGTISLKRRAGSDVALVFMTDGSQSHQHLIESRELKRIRTAEGLAAGRILGVEPGDIYLLDFAETHLQVHRTAAIDRVLEILRQRNPRQVFMPSRLEPGLWSEDHRATTFIVRAALCRWVAPHPVTVFEYPIWFYRQWPWTTWDGSRPEKMTVLRLSLRSPFGLGVLWSFRCLYAISDALEQKRAALRAHRSQMEAPRGISGWPTLRDVSSGTFLPCFLNQTEAFHRYELPRKHVSSG